MPLALRPLMRFRTQVFCHLRLQYLIQYRLHKLRQAFRPIQQSLC